MDFKAKLQGPTSSERHAGQSECPEQRYIANFQTWYPTRPSRKSPISSSAQSTSRNLQGNPSRQVRDTTEFSSASRKQCSKALESIKLKTSGQALPWKALRRF